MIEKSIRTYSEKTTSIDQLIEKSQKGIASERLKGAKKTLIIPTMLDNPKSIIITPLDVNGAALVSRGWFSDMVLYKASNSNVSVVLNEGTNAASNASLMSDVLVLESRKLYQSVVAVSSAQIASNSLVTASGALFRELTDYGTNQKRYLVVTTRATDSAAASGQTRFAWEVRGY